MKKLILIYDLDKTLCTKKTPEETYADVKPIQPMIDQLNKFYDEGHTIIISTARNMLTQKNHISRCIANVGLDTLLWLKKYNVNYHGLDFGKDIGDIYIDDKSCLDCPEEIERRIESIQNGTEYEYLNIQKQQYNKIKQLEQYIKELEEKLKLTKPEVYHE